MTIIKLAIIETGNTVMQQIEKIKTEIQELENEHFNLFQAIIKENNINYQTFFKNRHLEALDVLTASMNLVHMLNIPDEVIDEHYEKMKRYEVEKGYKIIKVVEVKDE